MKAPPETICGHCLQILCCAEHRLLHEIKRHGSHKKCLESPQIVLTTPNNFQIPLKKRNNLKRKRTSILPNLQELSSNDENMRNVSDVSLACNLLEESQNSSGMMEQQEKPTPNRYWMREGNRDSFLMPLPPQRRIL